jgi:predicted O-linked N-acetylglucosamine transferase (SPINDLY family)
MELQAAWEALDRDDFRAAEAAALQALAADPGDGEALFLLGSTRLFEGRHREALGPLSDAASRLERRGVRYRLAHCHLALGDYALAEAALRREARDYPDSANARNTLGVALVSQSRHEEALSALLDALRIAPDHVEANSNAGGVLHKLGRHEEALPYLRRALAAQPELVDASYNLGLALRALERHDEAVGCFARVVALAPQAPYALSALVWSELFTCEWAPLAGHTQALREQVRAGRVPAAPFTIMAASDSLDEQRQCAELHAREMLAGAAPEPLWHGPRSPHARLRIAYLSGDFHEHATAYLAARLFELHDRGSFEITGISYGPDDASVTRERLRRAFDRFVDVRAMSDADAAALLRKLEIDIAVDLKGHTAHARLGILAHRPAPVQATYLGYPGTLGAAFIDYALADDVVIPPQDERFYAERVVWLPHSYQVNDSTRVIAATPVSRAQAGLPEEGFVFCCFNNTYKLTAAMFDVWMRLLAAVPESRLWLVDHNARAKGNLQRAARERGIEPARLCFAPRVGQAEHLARHRLADLFLDNLPVNAHTTASDALWAGLPLVTCLGASFAGRVAASLLRAVGLPELVTRSLADYEAVALELARAPERLASLRQRLARNRLTHPLFDTDLCRRHIEAAYREMWQRFQRGEAPRSFSVAACA